MRRPPRAARWRPRGERRPSDDVRGTRAVGAHRSHRDDGYVAAARRTRLLRRRATADPSAAPSATVCFGCTLTATGLPSVPAISCATNGMRDQPPTRKHSIDLRRGHAGFGHGALQHRDRLGDRWSGSRFELDPCQANLTQAGRQRDVDDCLGVGRERLFRPRAVCRGFRAWTARDFVVCRVELVEVGSERLGDEAEDCGVEVDTAETLDASGRPMISNQVAVRRMTVASKVPPPRSYTAMTSPAATRSSLAYEAAAASGSLMSSASLMPASRIAASRTSRLNAPSSRDASLLRHQEVPPSASTTRSSTDRRTRRAQGVDRPRRAADQDRCRVADPPFELTGDAGRIGERPPASRARRRASNHPP